MTDQERAAVLWEHLVDLIDNAGDGTITRAIAADFAAVRLEERKMVVAYLRRWASLPGPDNDTDAAADAIERGEHEEARP